MKPPTDTHPLLQALVFLRDNPANLSARDKAVGHLEEHLDSLIAIIEQGMYWRVGFTPSKELSESLEAFYGELKNNKD